MKVCLHASTNIWWKVFNNITKTADIVFGLNRHKSFEKMEGVDVIKSLEGIKRFLFSLHTKYHQDKILLFSGCWILKGSWEWSILMLTLMDPQSWETMFWNATRCILKVVLSIYSDNVYQTAPSSDCRVKIRNIQIENFSSVKDGRCLELDNCSQFEVSHCSIKCSSDTSDLSPYPSR